ncbi:MAG: hypothetical protein R3E31_21685 [Chloroflexota bacterium]
MRLVEELRSAAGAQFLELMMQNGNAFHAFTEDALAYLGQWETLAYYREPLPSAVDERLAAMMTRLLAATPAEREQFQQALAAAQRALFGVFGHRAATLARRQESREWLRWGLLGTAVANSIIPPRRNVDVALVVFHHVARQLGINTVDLFDEVADFADGAIAERLRLFGRRSDVYLRSYGWREIKTPDGVAYKFSL